MHRADKQSVVEAVALARTGHSVIITATDEGHLAEFVKACATLSTPFDHQTMRINIGGGHIRFAVASRIIHVVSYDGHLRSESVMYAPTMRLPKGVKSIGDLAKKAVAHLERGKAGRLVIDEGDATSHAPKKKRKKRATAVVIASLLALHSLRAEPSPTPRNQVPFLQPTEKITVMAGDAVMLSVSRDRTIVIHCGDGNATIDPNGHVTFKNCEPNAAAIMFWAAIEQLIKTYIGNRELPMASPAPTK